MLRNKDDVEMHVHRLLNQADDLVNCALSPPCLLLVCSIKLRHSWRECEKDEG